MAQRSMPKLRKREPSYGEQVSSFMVDVECWASCRNNVRLPKSNRSTHIRFTVRSANNESRVPHREFDLLDVTAQPNTGIVQRRITGGLTLHKSGVAISCRVMCIACQRVRGFHSHLIAGRITREIRGDSPRKGRERHFDGFLE